MIEVGPVSAGSRARAIERRAKRRCFLSVTSKSRAAVVHRLGRAEEEQATPAQGEMENLLRLRLRVLVEVDEQVAAGDEVQPGRRAHP